MAIAVVIYTLLNMALGNFYPISRILISTIGYNNVGNSSWYIFAILVLYVIAFISLLIVKWRNDKTAWIIGCTIAFLLAVLAEIIQLKVGRPGYSYNTMFLFPVGMFYSVFRDKVEKVLYSSPWVFVGVIIVLLAVYIVSLPKRFKAERYFAIWVLMFTLIVVMVTMKVSFTNKVLRWCGENLFWLYILQRLPMIVLEHFGLIDSHRYISFVIVIITTVLLTIVVEWILDKATLNSLNSKEAK